MSSGVIYSITCPEGKSYIGKTTSRLSVRISRHKSKSSNCRAIRDAIVKNGIDNMTVKVLMKCSHHDLDENETLYITAMDTLHPRGYNLRCGSKAAAHKPDFKVSQHIIDVDEDVKNAVLDDIADLSGIKRTSLSWGGPITVTLGELNYMHGAKMNSPWAGPRPGQVKKDNVKGLFEDELRKKRAHNQISEEDIRLGEVTYAAQIRTETLMKDHNLHRNSSMVDHLMHRKKQATELGFDTSQIDEALKKLIKEGLE
jgi:group I intron endonuclease